METYLVLGGAKPGIGQAITRACLESGMAVMATVEREELEGGVSAFVDSHQTVSWHVLDSSNPQDCFNSLKSIDRVSRVINAEFYFYLEEFGSFDLSRWERSLFVNLTVPKIIGDLATAKWRATSVVMITSSEARYGSFGAHAYAATKSAVHNLVRSLANSAAGSCRYNAVAAGWIGGVMDTDEVFERSRSVTPLGRLGTAREIAATAMWLAGDSSSFVNGATLYADGGYTGVDTISKFEYESEFNSL